MSIWFYELFAPEALVRNVALFLVVVAVAMPTLGLVRIVALAGGVAGVILSSVVAFDRAGLFWWGLLTITMLIRVAPRYGGLIGGRLSAEETDFRERILPSLSDRQMRLLLRVGHWSDAESGHVFTDMGTAVTELVFLSQGRANVMVSGARVAEVNSGALIGEIGVSTGEPATATMVAATRVRFLSFNIKQFYPFLDKHEDIQDAIELAVDRSLRDKLTRANQVAAQGVDATVG